MDFSKYTVEEMQKIGSMQRKNLDELFERLQNSNDSEKIKIVESISIKDLRLKYDIMILESEVRNYRLDTLERLMTMCEGERLIQIDLVVWSHWRAIMERIESLLYIENGDEQ